MIQQIINQINALNERVGKAASWMAGLLVIWVSMDVLLRLINPYVSWQIYKPWMMEMEWHLFSLLFLFGAAYAFKHDRHVRVDLFYANFSKRDKALVNFVGTLIFLLPWCLIIIYTSFNFAIDSFQNTEGSANPGGLPYRFVIKFVLFFGITLLFLQGLAILLESFQTLMQPDEDEINDH